MITDPMRMMYPPPREEPPVADAEILAGRLVAPTAADLGAMIQMAPGERQAYRWRCVVDGRTYHDGMSRGDVEALRLPSGAAVRWWALDGRTGIPCAWPTTAGA